MYKHDSPRIGIVNPLTLVGNEVKEILRERHVPYESIRLIDTTGENEGTLTDAGDEPAVVTPADETSFADLDVVFFCGPPESNRRWLARYREDGFAAIDLAQPSSAGGDGVAVVAGINSEVVTAETRLVVSPHPIAIPIALILHQIRKRAPVELCAASVVQPASEFDQAGIDELFHQTIQVLNVESPPTAIFGRQLAFNLFPSASGATVEPYVVAQAHAVLGETLPIAVSITQGTIFHGHAFSVFIRTAKPLTHDEAVAALNASAAIHVGEDDEDRYSTIDAAAKDEVIVSRVTIDPSVTNALWVWAAADNVRRSAALNAVLIAERLIELLGEKVN